MCQHNLDGKYELEREDGSRAAGAETWKGSPKSAHGENLVPFQKVLHVSCEDKQLRMMVKSSGQQ